VHGAGAQLDLLRGAVDEQVSGVDRILQGGIEAEDAVNPGPAASGSSATSRSRS
jgi:hypothetical protein